jgi:hypothetical protein
MTSKQRVLATIRGEPVDRTPVTLWINPHTACRMISEGRPSSDWKSNIMARLLWRRFVAGGEQNAPELWRALPILLTAFANGRYALDLGADIAMLSADSTYRSQRLYREDGRLKIVDFQGSTRGVGGVYLDVIEPAIQSVEDLERHEFPDPGELTTLRRFRRKHPDAFILMEAFGVQDLFCTQVWEMSRFMLALYDHPQEVKAFQARFADWTIATIRHSVEAGADGILLYDDYGTTGRTLISMDMWREFTLPHLERIIDAAHQAGVPVILHSCGYQVPLLDDYVAIGLDALQSFQPKAGNDLAAACKAYGDRLAFVTGIDIQLGELMSPEELRQSILDNYHIGRRGARFILGTTHMLQYTMPAQNRRALFDTVAEIQTGIHD